MIDHNSSVPMYVQLANEISNAIYQGIYKSGDKLPSESCLCKEFSVSRITVRQALTLLIQQDLAFSVHGKGTFVKAPVISHELNQIISFNRVLQSKGLYGYTKVQGFEENASWQEAQTQLCGPISCLDMLGYASNMPIVYYRSFFSPELGKKMFEAAKQAEQAGEAFSTYDLYGRLNVTFTKVEQTLGAINADDTLERNLELPKRMALIVLKSTYYAANGSPLEYKVGYYRSDTYPFHLQRSFN